MNNKKFKIAWLDNNKRLHIISNVEIIDLSVLGTYIGVNYKINGNYRYIGELLGRIYVVPNYYSLTDLLTDKDNINEPIVKHCTSK